MHVPNWHISSTWYYQNRLKHANCIRYLHLRKNKWRDIHPQKRINNEISIVLTGQCLIVFFRHRMFEWKSWQANLILYDQVGTWGLDLFHAAVWHAIWVLEGERAGTCYKNCQRPPCYSINVQCGSCWPYNQGYIQSRQLQFNCSFIFRLFRFHATALLNFFCVILTATCGRWKCSPWNQWCWSCEKTSLVWWLWLGTSGIWDLCSTWWSHWAHQ